MKVRLVGDSRRHPREDLIYMANANFQCVYRVLSPFTTPFRFTSSTASDTPVQSVFCPVIYLVITHDARTTARSACYARM